MDNRIYCEVQDNKIVKYNVTRKQYSIGINSDEATCNAKNLWIIVGTQPAIDTATQRIGQVTYTFTGTQVDKTYEVLQISAEELLATRNKLVETTVQTMLDASAKTRGYDSVISECSYATSTGSFGAEAQVTVNWRDAVWVTVFAIQAEIAAGTKEEPTLDELMSELPAR